jgi:hypothetical protein
LAYFPENYLYSCKQQDLILLYPLFSCWAPRLVPQLSNCM